MLAFSEDIKDLYCLHLDTDSSTSSAGGYAFSANANLIPGHF